MGHDEFVVVRFHHDIVNGVVKTLDCRASDLQAEIAALTKAGSMPRITHWLTG